MVERCTACGRPIEVRRTMLGTPLGVDPKLVRVRVGEGADVAVLTETGVVARGKLVLEAGEGICGRLLHRDTCPEKDTYRAKTSTYR